MPANRRNPGVHHTARQSRDREGALADSVAGMRSLTVAARIGASRPSTFMSRTRGRPAGCRKHQQEPMAAEERRGTRIKPGMLYPRSSAFIGGPNVLLSWILLRDGNRTERVA